MARVAASLLALTKIADASLSTWMPDARTIYNDITFKPNAEEEDRFVAMKESGTNSQKQKRSIQNQR